jgi:clan AA aspartic protease
MITGNVGSRREAMVRLPVRGPHGRERETEVLVDTGFTGSLLLPSDLIAELNLPFLSTVRGVLADGSESTFDLYEGAILWDGRLRRISVGATGADPLLGMGLLYGSELRIEVVEGGSVLIRELPLS